MEELLRTIHLQANPEKAKLLARFFKTGRGEYGEGDLFLGIMVPTQREIAKKYGNRLTLNDVEYLLHNKYHECRLIALLILMMKYRKAEPEIRQAIVQLYLKNTRYINNWDLVDLSCRDILGAFLYDRDRGILYRLAKSPSLWERRISIISTFYFIARGEYEDSLQLAETLLHDPHDLIHKAVGWVLREIGKKDRETEERFLQKHHLSMPRTALRYAIERFEESKRKFYLAYPKSGHP